MRIEPVVSGKLPVADVTVGACESGRSVDVTVCRLRLGSTTVIAEVSSESEFSALPDVDAGPSLSVVAMGVTVGPDELADEVSVPGIATPSPLPPESLAPTTAELEIAVGVMSFM